MKHGLSFLIVPDRYSRRPVEYPSLRSFLPSALLEVTLLLASTRTPPPLELVRTARLEATKKMKVHLLHILHDILPIRRTRVPVRRILKPPDNVPHILILFSVPAHLLLI